MKNIKVMVIDDEKSFCSLVKRCLKKHGYLVYCYYDTENIIDKIKRIKPSLILLDIIFKNNNIGLNLLEEIKVFDNELLVIIVTGHSNTNITVNAMRIGAYDVIDKPFELNTFCNKITHALKENQEKIAQVLNQESVVPKSNDSTSRIVEINNMKDKLSTRELEVLELYSKRHSYKDIADKLGLSIHTVKSHMENIMKKIGINRRHEILSNFNNK